MDRVKVLEDRVRDLEKRNFILKKNNTNLLMQLSFLISAIEHARVNKTRVGAELALRELIIDVRDGNLSPKYRDEETIKMLQERFNA